jgi:HemY protein
MTRLVAFLFGVLGLAALFSWLADNPGTIVIDWMGYHAEPTVFQAVVMLAVMAVTAVMLWSLLRTIWTGPAAISHVLTRRRQQRGLDALSSGMIAIGSGDLVAATRYATHARKALPHEPMTHLLRAQAAQLSGDRATARRIYEAMLSSPDTEQLGLRGLYVEAEREGETEAQRQFAERAFNLNPKLPWPAEGLFDLQCKDGDWDGALRSLNVARKNATVEKDVYDRRRAVLLTAQATQIEDSESDKALNLALEAHALARDLIPAAAVSGRLLATKGNVARAAKVIQKTWSLAPHPDLATAYAFARIGDSPRDRLDRVRQLASTNPNAIESAIAVATAAIEARDWSAARTSLNKLSDGRMTRAACLLMAKLEREENGDTGRAREWLARAANAPRDAAWTADGAVLSAWAPVSPVSGHLDCVSWRVPVDDSETRASSDGLDEFVALGGYDTASRDIVVREHETTAPAAARMRPVVISEPPRPAPPPPPTAAMLTISDVSLSKKQTASATVTITAPSKAAASAVSKNSSRPEADDADAVDTSEVTIISKGGPPKSSATTAKPASNGAANPAQQRQTHAPDDPGPSDDSDEAPPAR